MTAFNRVRLWWGLTWATLRERLAPLPVDDEARIIDWVPDESRIANHMIAGPVTSSYAINHTVMDDGDTRNANRVTSIDKQALSKPLLVRTEAVTELVALGVHIDDPHPIHDALVAELEALEAAKRRALRTPTAEFWAIVDALRGYFCTHCADDGDHTQCPGCECGCKLLDTPGRTLTDALR